MNKINYRFGNKRKARRAWRKAYDKAVRDGLLQITFIHDEVIVDKWHPVASRISYFCWTFDEAHVVPKGVTARVRRLSRFFWSRWRRPE